MFRRTKVCSGVLVALGGALSLGSAPVFGQQTFERVEITGSSVRRVDAEGALPVTVLKKEDIARTGATSVVDLLQKLPTVMGGTVEADAVGGSTFGFSGISIHNIGETRTLVLLNGHRLAQFGGQTLTGFAAGVDLNSIPIAAIERVEILTDGASALYGADAIAGVVNFITKRDTTEGDVTIGFSKPEERAQRRSASAFPRVSGRSTRMAGTSSPRTATTNARSSRDRIATTRPPATSPSATRGRTTGSSSIRRSRFRPT